MMDVVSRNDCWLWAGTTSGGGWAMLGSQMAYRIMYENEVGEIPTGLEIDHLCEVPRCINPKHLEPVTHQQNLERHYRRRTHCKYGHEFTEENTRWIKKKGNISKANPSGLSRYCRTCNNWNARYPMSQLPTSPPTPVNLNQESE